MDLAAMTVDLFRLLIPKLLAVAPDAVMLPVINPVDVMMYVAQKLSGLPPGRVFWKRDGVGQFVVLVPDRTGVETTLPVPLNPAELAGLQNSAETMRASLKTLGY